MMNTSYVPEPRFYERLGEATAVAMLTGERAFVEPVIYANEIGLVGSAARRFVAGFLAEEAKA